MTIYKKQNSTYGAWVKGSQVTAGTKVEIVSETIAQPSQFQDKNGNMKTQDVCKVRFQGGDDSLNISLNRATLNALIDAFGEDSKLWIGKILTAHTEKVAVAGKRVTAVYLLPENYIVQEDADGYIQIVNPSKETIQEPPHDDPNVQLDVNGNEINSDIPF